MQKPQYQITLVFLFQQHTIAVLAFLKFSSLSVLNVFFDHAPLYPLKNNLTFDL